MSTLPFRIRTLVLFYAITWTAVCLCDEPPQDTESEASAEQRMDVMRKRIDALKAVGVDEQPLEFTKAPLLRYSDSENAISDATVWGLGKTGRLHALVVLEVYAGRSVQYEFTATPDPPKSVKGSSWQWEPRANGFAWHEIPNQAPPKDARAERRSRISELAGEFEAKEEFRGRTSDLELLAKPLHWYQDEAEGVLDGAVFVLAFGKNAEILLFIEARAKKKDEPRWAAGFARLGSAKFDVTFADQDFWSAPADYGDAKSVYFFRMESLTEEEQAVFGVPRRQQFSFPF